MAMPQELHNCFGINTSLCPFPRESIYVPNFIQISPLVLELIQNKEEMFPLYNISADKMVVFICLP